MSTRDTRYTIPLYAFVQLRNNANVRMYSSFSHIDESGKANMVDVGEKSDSKRKAVAVGHVKVDSALSRLIAQNHLKKGDVLSVAELAGTMAAKRTSELIPLCHPLSLTYIKVTAKLNERLHRVELISEVRCNGKTGVEMEALTAVSVAALTIYDMCKNAAAPGAMEIHGIQLMSKTGGTKGDFKADTV